VTTKSNGRPEGIPKRPNFTIDDGGNLPVFVLRRNGVATAITSSNSLGDGDDAQGKGRST
jgi:hypothetical protein